jgi:hypothetical protein
VFGLQQTRVPGGSACFDGALIGLYLLCFLLGTGWKQLAERTCVSDRERLCRLRLAWLIFGISAASTGRTGL